MPHLLPLSITCASSLRINMIAAIERTNQVSESSHIPSPSISFTCRPLMLPWVRVPPRLIPKFLTTFLPCATYCHSITVCQTRNHLASDVEYIASKTITIPDPQGKVRSTTLSKLGFGTRTQKFWLRWTCVSLFSSSSNFYHSLQYIIGHFLQVFSCSPPREITKIPTSRTTETFRVWWGIRVGQCWL